MSTPDRPGPIADRQPLTTDELLHLVAQTRKKVSDAASDLEMLSHELRLRLGMAVDDMGGKR